MSDLQWRFLLAINHSLISLFTESPHTPETLAKAETLKAQINEVLNTFDVRAA